MFRFRKELDLSLFFWLIFVFTSCTLGTSSVDGSAFRSLYFSNMLLLVQFDGSSEKKVAIFTISGFLFETLICDALVI